MSFLYNLLHLQKIYLCNNRFCDSNELRTYIERKQKHHWEWPLLEFEIEENAFEIDDLQALYENMEHIFNEQAPEKVKELIIYAILKELVRCRRIEKVICEMATGDSGENN